MRLSECRGRGWRLCETRACTISWPLVDHGAILGDVEECTFPAEFAAPFGEVFARSWSRGGLGIVGEGAHPPCLTLALQEELAGDMLGI